MSDDKKAGGDVAADQAKAPIVPEEVEVTVKPRQENLPKKTDPAREAIVRQNEANKDLADKAKDQATKDVRDAIKKAAPKGRDAQKDAADKAAQDVADKLPRRAIREIQVDIPTEEPIIAPATEGPPPDPPPAKKSI